jgi:hypothetical protein
MDGDRKRGEAEMVKLLTAVDAQIGDHFEWTAEGLEALGHWLEQTKVWVDAGWLSLDDEENPE